MCRVCVFENVCFIIIIENHMKKDVSEVVILEPLNSKDYKVIDKTTGRQIGFMLRKADAKLGFDLHPNFSIPFGVIFPSSAKTLLEGYATFNRTYRIIQDSLSKS